MDFNIEETWCFTGHRPDKLYGYNKINPGNLILQGKLEYSVRYLYKVYGIKNWISGMAPGWDTMGANGILRLKEILSLRDLKLICAIPCKDHMDNLKSKEEIEEYKNILDKADFVHYVSNRNFFANCLQRRNEFMVDNSVGQLACWNGSKGGTYNCLQYANKKEKTKRIIINPVSFNERQYI